VVTQYRHARLHRCACCIGLDWVVFYRIALHRAGIENRRVDIGCIDVLSKNHAVPTHVPIYHSGTYVSQRNVGIDVHVHVHVVCGVVEGQRGDGT
jgi:hypothetical protein